MLSWAGRSGVLAGGYFTVGALAGIAAIAARRRAAASEIVEFWAIVTALLAMLGIGRFTRLGGRITAFGRRVAYSEGWYWDRRRPQALLLLGIVLLAVAVLGATASRAQLRRPTMVITIVAMLGLALLAASRVVSLHQVDSVLYRREVSGLQVGCWLEWAGLATLTLAATGWARGARAG